MARSVEDFWSFSKASDSQLKQVVVLAFVNLGLVLVFFLLHRFLAGHIRENPEGGPLQSTLSRVRNPRNAESFETVALRLAWWVMSRFWAYYGFFFSYALLFFAVPYARWWYIRRLNADVQRRNTRRRQLTARFNSTAHPVPSFLLAPGGGTGGGEVVYETVSNRPLEEVSLFINARHDEHQS